MATVAVLTFPMKCKDGKTYTCNMVEGLEVSIGRIKERFDDLERKGYEWDAEHKQLKKIEPKEKPTEFEKGVKATLEQMQGFPVTDESVALYAAQLLLVAKKQLREEFDKQLELAYKNADEVQYGRGYRKAVEDARKWVAFVAGNDDVWIESFNRTMEKRYRLFKQDNT